MKKPAPATEPAKRLTLCYSDQWQATFEILDLDAAGKACKASLDFFGDPITREDDSPLEYVKAFLKLWGPDMVKTSELPFRLPLEREMQNREGCIPLDGSQGIKLIHSDRWEFDAFEFSVQEPA